MPTLKKCFVALSLSAFLYTPSVVAENLPVPSKRPETFYASPEMLKQIRRRMDSEGQNHSKPRYKAVKSKRHNYDIIVNDTDADQILDHVREMNLERY